MKLPIRQLLIEEANFYYGKGENAQFFGPGKLFILQVLRSIIHIHVIFIRNLAPGLSFF